MNYGVCPICGKHRQLLSEAFLLNHITKLGEVRRVCNGCWATKFKPLMKLKRFGSYF